jgi:glycosyltransferase involved in cell wall biosynthesis
MTKSETLVIVPAFNERDSVGAVVESIRELGFAVVVVDDGSSDDTASVARAAGARVLCLSVNMGVGGALRCGFKFAIQHGYSAVVQCDADGQHLPEYIAKLIDAADLESADLVIGSRFLIQGAYPWAGRARRVAMLLLAKIASRAVGGALTDVTSGFRLVRGQLLTHFAREFPPYYLGDTFESTISAGRAGYRVVEVPVQMNGRTHGFSSESAWASIVLIAKVLIINYFGLRLRVPPPVRTTT